MIDQQATGLINSIMTAALWALTGIFVKLLSELPALDILFYRSLVAFLFFLLAIIYKKKALSLFSIPKKRTLLASGLMFFYYTSATLSFYLAPVAAAAIFISTSPCFAMIIKSINGIRPKAKEVMGFSISFASLTLFVLVAKGDFGGYSYNATIIGSLLGISAGFFRALYSFLLWRRPEHQSDLNQISINTFIIAIAVLSPIHFIYSDEQAFQTFDYLYIVCLGVFATALPNLLHSLASEKVDPTIHSVVGTLTPVIAAVLAWFIFNEKIPILGVFAIAGSLAGIMIMTLPFKRTRPL